ncbi:serum response factor-binding protein 1 isoform X2 [Vanacampus margaritifer]
MASNIEDKEEEDMGEESNNGDEKESVGGEAEGEIEDFEEDGGDSEDVKEKDCSDDEEEEEEESEKAQVETEKNPDHVPIKKKPEVLNLNNEVVYMRKEVKRVKALLSRKIIRQIAGLKKKKGTEAVIEKNQRRVARLLEEIHAMKMLRPDFVTKTALQKNFNFNEVCKNTKSTMSDRAIARIAAHPQFKKKIEDIRAAVKAFSEERRKGGKQTEQKEKRDDEKVALHSLDVKAKQVEKRTKAKKETSSKEVKKITNDDDKDTKVETISSEPEMTNDDNKDKKVETISSEPEMANDDNKDKKVETISSEPEITNDDDKDTKVETISSEPGMTNDDNKDKKVKTISPEPDEDKMESTQVVPVAEKKVTAETKIVKPASSKKSEPQVQERKKQQAKAREDKPKMAQVTAQGNKPKMAQVIAQENKPKMVSKPTKQEEKEEESDLSDEEDKPYFDDSTEERFHKQSSQEESDSDNDFFVGKVSKFKKKKKKNIDDDTTKEASTEKSKTADKIQSELDELESRLKTKQPKLQTVFCSLSQTKPNRGGRGKPFRGQGKQMGRGRGDFDQTSTFQKEERANYRGRGRGAATGQRDRRGPGGVSHQAPQQALHPSWEASKKRKEQQGQILAFQGKKIKFDD